MLLQKLCIVFLSFLFFIKMPRSSLKRKRAFAALDRTQQKGIKIQEYERENMRTRKHKSRDRKSQKELDRWDNSKYTNWYFCRHVVQQVGTSYLNKKENMSSLLRLCQKYQKIYLSLVLYAMIYLSLTVYATIRPCFACYPCTMTKIPMDIYVIENKKVI